MSFRADPSDTRSGVVLHLIGDLDATADTALFAAHEQAVALNPRQLVLDFSEVDYINSSGIALLVTLLIDARRDERPMRAVGLSSHYRHIFEITRLTDYMELGGDGTAPAANTARSG